MSAPRALKLMTPPVKLSGVVVHGFGRGSSKLGFPTANMRIRWDAVDDRDTLRRDEREVLDFVDGTEPGIYAAYARVCDGTDHGVYKVAMSVGWNPTFTDVKRKTLEAWLLHDFADDFYDRLLRVIVVGYVRPEFKFESLDGLIAEIREDGNFCSNALETHAHLERDSFFSEPLPDDRATAASVSN